MTFLSGLKLDEYDTPGVAVAAKDDGGDGEGDVYHIVTIKRISTGEEILYCDVDPAPDEAVEEAARLGLPVFTCVEIPHIRAAVAGDPEKIEKIIEMKKAFPYSRFRFSPESGDTRQ